MKDTYYDAVLDMLVAKYNSQPPFSWGVLCSWALGGQDPLEKVHAYPSEEERPHWHYVGVGLSDPDKVKTTSTDPESGLGYELTFRLPRGTEAEAPAWPVGCLQEMGWGILKHRMRIGKGHYIRRRRTLTGDTSLCGYYVIDDPGLPRIESASGTIDFLELVGVTDNELKQCESGDPDGMKSKLLDLSPIGISDLNRNN